MIVGPDAEEIRKRDELKRTTKEARQTQSGKDLEEVERMLNDGPADIKAALKAHELASLAAVNLLETSLTGRALVLRESVQQWATRAFIVEFRDATERREKASFRLSLLVAASTVLYAVFFVVSYIWPRH